MLKNGLLINPFGIGDVLFTTPIIHTLKHSLTDIKLGYLCNRRTASILKDNPYIDYLFIYERDEFAQLKESSYLAWIKKSLSFLNEIKEKKFDFSIDFSLNSQYGFFSWYAGIRMRIGYDYKGRGWLLTKKIKLQGYESRHIVDFYADLLKLLELNVSFKNLELYLSKEDIEWADKFLIQNGIAPDEMIIGIVPGAGASWGNDAYLKQWPIDYFSLLIDKIIANYKVKIIIMGDLSDKKVVAKLTRRIIPKVIEATGKTDLGQFAALISKMNLVITNDGGPLHLAVALGIKTVSIFGPVDERVYGPYPGSSEQIVVKKGLDCQPCYRRFKMPECLNNRQCLTSLSVDEVYEKVKRILNEIY